MTETMEPTAYFDKIKGSLQTSELEKLEAQVMVLAAEIEKAERHKMINLRNRLAFAYDTVVKEQVLVSNGFSKYIFYEDIVKYVDSIKPKNSVKIVELSRFPRLVPDEVYELIGKARNLEVFSELFIVYTDFTDDDYVTPVEKEIVNRNKDPIVFGAFDNMKGNYRHERYYFIADWEDEYCDLTFTKMIAKLGDEALGTIPESVDLQHINKLIADIKHEFLKDPKTNWWNVFLDKLKIKSSRRPDHE